jgi:hypothetical protein
LAPSTIGAVYNLDTGLVAPSGTAGAGQVIAVVDAYHDPNALSDLNAFNTEYGYPTLSTCSSGPPFTATTGACFYQADPQGTPTTNSNWTLEESLDIEWAHAEAPGATIVLVEADTSNPALLFDAVGWANDNGATEVSMSWYSSESSDETSYDSYFDATSTSSGAPILYTAATGDGGHAVGYPAASPNVIGVGGTTLNGCSDTSCANFTSETTWSDSGGGVSAYEKIPTYQSTYSGPVHGESSGGISALTDGERGVPDVSFDANPNTGVSAYDSTSYDGQSGWFTLGGTSVGAPNWAGILAVGEGRAGPLQGAQKIYGVGYESFLRDVTSGTNGSCGTDCTAGAGYDLVTGLGSPMNYPPPASVTIPPFPAASVTNQTVTAPGVTQQFGTYPNWLPANQSVSNVDHSEGSDTTLYMMQSISNLYAQAGINPFSCTLSSTDNSSCSSTSGNAAQADLTDNYASTEELQGINDVGSSNGIAELCGSGPNPPSGTTVDYARSSRPTGLGTTCSGGTVGELGYAKDAVVPLDFQTIDPEAYQSTGDEAPGYVGHSFISYCQTATQPGCTTVGQTLTTTFPSTGIGPVAAGWEPGNSFTCTPTAVTSLQGTANYCSGTPFTSLTNTPDVNSGNDASSVAYRLFCQNGTSATPYESQILDWGNLTNLSAAANGGTAVAPGDGAPIGVPVRIIGVNSGSGTTSTFYSFAQSGYSSGANCSGATPLGASSGVDANAASGQNPQINQGLTGPANGANLEIAVENDANQIGDFANADWATSSDGDAADQAIDIATSLYFESLGVYSTNANAQVASVEIPSTATTGMIPSGQPGTFLAAQMDADGQKASLTDELTNSYAMSRTLFNVYNTNGIRASTGGFFNWLCDSNNAFQKGTDHVSGGDFDTNLTNLILGQYGFQRLSDSTPELAVANQEVVADGITGNVNGSCAANLTVASTGGVGSDTINLSAAPPQPVQVGWQAYVPAGSNVATPIPGTTPPEILDVVLGISGDTITLGKLSTTITTVASGSNGGSLSNIASWTSPGTDELAVASVSGLPSSGVVDVATSGGYAIVGYTDVDTVHNYLTGATYLSQSSPGAATTVSTGATVTLLTAADLTSGTGSSAPSTLYFPGHPPILSVTAPNT